MAGVSADLELAIDAALAQVDALEARLAEVTTGVSVDLQAEVDTATAEAELAGLSSDPVAVDVTADTGAAQAEIDGLDASPVSVDVDANTAGAEAALSDLGDAASQVGEQAQGGGAGLLNFAGAAGVANQASAGASTNLLGLSSALSSSQTAVGGAALGYGALAFAVFDVTQAYGEAEAVAAVTDQVIRATGGAANLTAEEIAALSGRVSEYAALDDEAVQSATNLLLTFRQVRDEAGEGNDIFTRATFVLADLSRAGFGDASSNAVRLGRALQDPVSGLTALTRAGVTFTQEQKDQVTQLVETGQTLEAQKIILDEIEAQVGGVGRAYGETLPGQLESAGVSFGNLKEEIGSNLAPAIVGASEVAELFTDVLAGADDTIQDLTGGVVRLADVLPGLGPLSFLGRLRAGPQAFATVVVQKDLDLINHFGSEMESVGTIAGQLAATVTTDFADIRTALNDLATTASSSVDEATAAFEDLNENGRVGIEEFLSGIEDAVAREQNFLNAINTLIERGADDLAASLLEQGSAATEAAEEAANANDLHLISLEDRVQRANEINDLQVVAAEKFGDDLSRAYLIAGARSVGAFVGALYEGRPEARDAGKALGTAAGVGVGEGRGAASVAGASVGRAAVSAVSSQIGPGASAGRSVGVAIGQGIASGVGSAAGTVAGAIASLVSQGLAAGKVAAGISSPSTVFRDEVGVPIAQGVAEGIAVGTASVETQMRRMVAVPALSSTPRFQHGGEFGGGSFSQTINFHGPVGDPKAVGDEVKRGTSSALESARIRTAVKLRQPT